MTKNSLITLTSDFGVQSQGIGLMHAIIFKICPKAKVIDLMHGISSFSLIATARTLEAIRYMPSGIHVCVCDPGVGGDRRAIACQVHRGDYLIGPDNGILQPAARILGGIMRAHELTNDQYMNTPVSPLFHGRDIFSPAAAHLANGVNLRDFGPSLDIETLTPAPYQEATVDDRQIHATVIQINKFGSAHFNILHEQWDSTEISLGDLLHVHTSKGRTIEARYARTFSDAPKNSPVVLKDDYGRVCIALNQGSFSAAYDAYVGQDVRISAC